MISPKKLFKRHSLWVSTFTTLQKYMVWVKLSFRWVKPLKNLTSEENLLLSLPKFGSAREQVLTIEWCHASISLKAYKIHLSVCSSITLMLYFLTDLTTRLVLRSAVKQCIMLLRRVLLSTGVPVNGLHLALLLLLESVRKMDGTNPWLNNLNIICWSGRSLRTTSTTFSKIIKLEAQSGPQCARVSWLASTTTVAHLRAPASRKMATVKLSNAISVLVKKNPLLRCWMNLQILQRRLAARKHNWHLLGPLQIRMYQSLFLVSPRSSKSMRISRQLK